MMNLKIDGNIYLENKENFVCVILRIGFDAKQAAIFCEYNAPFCKAPQYRIMRKVNDVIDYLIAKNQIVSSIVKPTWILDQYLKMYQTSQSQITKQNILKQLSRIYQMVNQNNNVKIQNNIPQTPVQIVFGKDEDNTPQ